MLVGDGGPVPLDVAVNGPSGVPGDTALAFHGIPVLQPRAGLLSIDTPPSASQISRVTREVSRVDPVGRAVDTLEANDLVWETTDGNRRLIQINRDRLSVPDDPFLEIPQVEFHEPVKAAVDELTERLEDVVGIILYGSVARGEADRRSDIDLWVLVGADRQANQREANAVQVDLEECTFENNRYGYDIDVEAVASIPAYPSDVREIVVSGIIVYETPNFETIRNLLRNETDSDE
jgi:predicted nucleotidyltransferase